MATEAQLNANRANAQHSTGPRTTQGRSAIRHNHMNHGLTAAFVVLPGEDSAAFDELLLDLTHYFSPANKTEQLLVATVAQRYWLTQRAIRLQQQVLEKGAIWGGPSPSASHNATQAKDLALYIRYESSHDRAYHKALNQLIRIRAERRRAEIGFESQKARNELHQAKLALLAAKLETEKRKHQEATRATQRKEELHNRQLAREKSSIVRESNTPNQPEKQPNVMHATANGAAQVQ